MFTTRSNILECIDSLKLKNTEGYDRIPQRILIDGRDFSIEPLSNLFELFSHFIKMDPRDGLKYGHPFVRLMSEEKTSQ